ISPPYTYTHYDPRPLPHSFPTRRSSDLDRNDKDRIAVPQPLELLPADLFVYFIIKFRHLAISHEVRCDRAADGIEVPHELHIARSEEHTSELQSHLNLVCRLLLEKKKYK